MRAANRLSAVSLSPILAMGALAAARARTGRPVIVLAAGEPDFETPAHVIDAATRAMHAGQTKYTALEGTIELRDAIREKFRRENSLEFAREEIICGAGAKQILFNAFLATLDPGDEVILAAPYWTSYSDIVALCGGRPVSIPCNEDKGFKLTAEDLDRAISERTRWLLINSPSNPSGAAYESRELLQLTSVLERHPHVALMSDDIYEHLLYDGRIFVTPLQIAPNLRSRTLIVNGLSKAYAMTGWRIGYGAGPKAMITAMAVVQSQSTSCPSSISQAAAIGALLGSQATIGARREKFQLRRDSVVDALNRVPGLRCRRPEGAFYAYVYCGDLIGRRTTDGITLESDFDVCRSLLDSADVAVVPGSAFGLSPYFRVSYATSEDVLREALDRISEFCRRLQ